MQEIIRTTADRAKAFKEYFMQEALDAPEFSESIIYLGYEAETSKLVSAAVVYPSLGGARLLSIGVSEEKKNEGAGKELISLMAKDLKTVYNDFGEGFVRLLVHECFESDVWEGLGSFFEKSGFSLKDSEPMMRATLSDIGGSQFLRRAIGKNSDKKILPLSELKRESFLAFEQHIVTEGLYPGIDVELLDPDYSMFYLEDLQVKGCILMSPISENEYMNEWVFMDKSVKDSSILLSMLAKCAERGVEQLPLDTKVWFIPTDLGGEKFLEKVLPNAIKDREIRRYEMQL